MIFLIIIFLTFVLKKHPLNKVIKENPDVFFLITVNNNTDIQ